MKLSVVIMAHNEEEKIEACLQSITNFAQEIIVIDNNSTDRTAAIAQKYTRNILHQPNDPEKIDLLKNFGISKATGDWILLLDADERLTEELKEEIKKRLTDEDLSKGTNPKSQIVGYWIPRKNIIFGKWIEHTGWYPDEQLRLFQRGKGAYNSLHVHEQLQLTGEAVHLTQPFIHENYQTIHQFISKTLLYAQNEAAEKIRNGYIFNYLDCITWPVQEFLSRYFARRGYKDGLHGLVLSLLMGWYHLMMWCFIWEKEKFVKKSGSDVISSVEKEAQRSYKELLYWFSESKISSAKSLSKRVMLKIKRKIYI